MSTQLVELNTNEHTVVKRDYIERLTAHLNMVVDYAKDMKVESPPLPDKEAIRTIIANHHRRMFINANQREPDEADQQYLDQLTQDLMFNLGQA